MEVDVVVKLKLKGVEVELTPDELKALRDTIDTILGKNEMTYIPYTPVIPEVPWRNPIYPFYPDGEPIITWSTHSRVK